MPRTTDYALVVGIDHYTRRPFKALSGAVSDALDFCDWVKSPSGGDVAAENVDPFTIVSRAGQPHPTFSDLITCLGNLLAKAGEDNKIGRRLYLFFAGHGVSANKELDDAGLVTVEAFDVIVPYLAGKKCMNLFAGICAFDEVVLFMDCCRTTSPLTEMVDLPIHVRFQAKAGIVRRFAVFAVPFGEAAREVDTGGGVMRGVFSRILMERLRDPKGDANRNLTTTLLRTHLDEVKRGLPPENQFQFHDVGGEIRLIENLPAIATTALQITVAANFDRVDILDGGAAFAVVQTLPAGPANSVLGPISLPMGKNYLIRVYFPGNQFQERSFAADAAIYHAYL